MQALAPRLGVAEADVAAVVVPPGAPVCSAHGGTRLRAHFPPVGHDGTERRLERPQD